VGTNGISVYARGVATFAPLLVHEGLISSTVWTHLAVVVNSSTPVLFVNGQLARVGLAAPSLLAYGPQSFGGASEQFYAGALDNIMVHGEALSPMEVQQLALGPIRSRLSCSSVPTESINHTVALTAIENDTILIKGRVLGDITLDDTSRIYHQTGMIYVPKNASLVVKKGVTVRPAPGVGITVHGVLR
jgi:hypothetical protein